MKLYEIPLEEGCRKIDEVFRKEVKRQKRIYLARKRSNRKIFHPSLADKFNSLSWADTILTFLLGPKKEGSHEVRQVRWERESRS